MLSWIQRASILLLLLLSFNTSSLVFATPQHPHTRLARQLKPLGAETNAKRFAMGLPPLSPVRRGSRTDTARRSTTSDTQVVTNRILVSSSDGPIGYLARRGNSQTKYMVEIFSISNQFQATLFTTGGTSQVNLFDINAPATTPYLAGLISPGIELLSTTGGAAILGGASLQTSQGSTPQSSGTTSIVGDEYETAIWNVSPSSALTLSWVNHNGGSPSISFVWDPVGLTMYLTANPSFILMVHRSAFTVTLSFEKM